MGVIFLRVNKSEFEASSLFTYSDRHIIECLDFSVSARPLLKAMALSGFAPIKEPKNAAVEMIAKLNIGGVVSRESTICGLPNTKWHGTECTYALIPSSESVRL
jgi:hypothetical protein